MNDNFERGRQKAIQEISGKRNSKICNALGYKKTEDNYSMEVVNSSRYSTMSARQRLGLEPLDEFATPAEAKAYAMKAQNKAVNASKIRWTDPGNGMATYFDIKKAIERGRSQRREALRADKEAKAQVLRKLGFGKKEG